MRPLVQPAAAARAAASSVVQGAPTKAWKRKARGLLDYRLKSKYQQDVRTRRLVAANGGGVELFGAAAEGIGSLTDLHTLGVVNVAGSASAFLQEVKKLTQLRKLGLSGINRQNWESMCEAISGQFPHLQSLSMQLVLQEEDGGRFDFACFDRISEPPIMLQHLKVLYKTTQGTWIRPAWIKELPDPFMLKYELTISSQENIKSGVSTKPVEEHLSFGSMDDGRTFRIECSGNDPKPSKAKVTFRDGGNFPHEAISLHCCCSLSSESPFCRLQINGLNQMKSLKEVTVTGTYAEGLKLSLREQLEEHTNKSVNFCDPIVVGM
ncbi:hypothetical protein ACQ4PT_047008 [Festuca glaucescens]